MRVSMLLSRRVIVWLADTADLAVRGAGSDACAPHSSSRSCAFFPARCLWESDDPVGTLPATGDELSIGLVRAERPVPGGLRLLA